MYRVAPKCLLESAANPPPLLAVSLANSLCNLDFFRGVILAAADCCIILSLPARLPEAFSCRYTISVGFSNVS